MFHVEHPKITRIQWSARRVTIYDTAGVFAILEGPMMDAFGREIAKAFMAMGALLKKEKADATHQVEVQTGSLGEHQEGNGLGSAPEAGGSDRALSPAPRSEQ
jgi:hypothetical protein